MPRPRPRPWAAGIRTYVAGAVALCLLASCSLGSTEESTTATDKTVVVATHDSWAMSPQVMRQFTKQTGYRVKVEPNGDAGQLTNKLVLTKGSPIADAAYGIDNTFASRAVDQGVLAAYTPERQPASASDFALADPDQAERLTPVDFGDVCVNVDDVWFAEHDLAPPRTLGDLVRPAYRNLFVAPGATSSSPGLAFLLATIARYGDGWPSYWKKLMANGTKLTSGWSDAYEVDFTAGGGKGDRPVVLSYASSPPFTIPEGARRPTTSSLLGTCFRQVEYAGVISGARNPDGAEAFVEFMTQRAFQEALPENMYVFPVDRQATLPPAWAKFARTASKPFTLPPAEIAKNRDAWLREWGDITSR
jgi:thiamine transport system substrate-binding protein